MAWRKTASYCSVTKSQLNTARIRSTLRSIASPCSRFDTRSSILGSTDWHRYFDMTNQADVDALLLAIDGLRSNGGTNWAHLMAGSTLVAIPGVVFFRIVQSRMTSGLVAGAVKG